jgi:hypothetical protein
MQYTHVLSLILIAVIKLTLVIIDRLITQLFPYRHYTLSVALRYSAEYVPDNMLLCTVKPMNDIVTCTSDL